MNQLTLLLKLLRPHQWIKSGFVFVGLLFGHVWNNGPVVQQVLLAAVAFSLAASSMETSSSFLASPTMSLAARREFREVIQKRQIASSKLE